MELKDIILSTLQEIEDQPQERAPAQNRFDLMPQNIKKIAQSTKSNHDEELFLENIRERLLVIFEGFQSPNNKNIEAKIDLTLNFLEFLLAQIEKRVQQIKDEKDD